MHFARKRDTAVFWAGLGLAIALGVSQMPVMAVSVLLMVYLLLDRSSAHRDELRHKRLLADR